MKRLLSLSLLFLSGIFAQQQAVKIPVYGVPGLVDASVMVLAVEASIDASVAKQNQNAADQASNGCRDWTVNNLHNRDLNLAVTPKPVQAPAVHVSYTTQGAGSSIIITATTSSGPDLAGILCPDLPPAVPTQPAKGTVQIGNHNFGLYWAQGPKDNPPDETFNGKPFSGTSLDGISGTWMFMSSPMSSEIYGRKGWYLKLN